MSACCTKVVNKSNVVLILNARDLAGCRSWLVEEELGRCEAEGKRLVFVLNKIGTCVSSPQHTSCTSLVIDIMLCAVRLCLLVDLVPRENAQVSTTSATQPQHSPSTLRARISTQTSPLELHLRPQGVQTERSAGHLFFFFFFFFNIFIVRTILKA
jgi:hypothetical protein